MSKTKTPKKPDDQEPKPESTTPAEEWGERVETGRRIARGGKDEGNVDGATGDDENDPRSGGDQNDPDSTNNR